MSKQIDITKPLSDEDRAYLEMMGRHDMIERADTIAAGSASARTESKHGPLEPGTSAEEMLALTPNTGDVNSGVAKQAGTDDGNAERAKALAAQLEENYTKQELKDECDKRELDNSGNKKALSARLAAHLIESGALDDTDDDDDDDDDDDADDDSDDDEDDDSDKE